MNMINDIYKIIFHLYDSPTLDRQFGLIVPRSFNALIGLWPL
jgi:hypothetical protein